MKGSLLRLGIEEKEDQNGTNIIHQTKEISGTLEHYKIRKNKIAK